MLSQLSVAVIEALRERARPVITSYELFRLLWDIYENPTRYAAKVIRRVRSPGSTQYAKVIYELGAERLLRPDPDFGAFPGIDTRVRVFRISEVPDAPAEDIICSVDPFSFISHLSAMQRYGLTVRQPTDLYISTPAPRIWSRRRFEIMTKDYGFDPREADLKFFKALQSVEITDNIRGRSIKTHHTTRDYASQAVSGTFSRLITIGDIFVQMLDDPDNCGGMHHVIETWENHAEYYAEDIIDSVEKSQTDIVKVRAGYILSERIEIQDARIDAWKRFAQRGGSRRLNPSGPYKPVFSEDWMISIND